MNRRIIILFLSIVFILSCVSFAEVSIATEPEAQSQAQISIAFEKDGNFRDLSGEHIELEELLKIGDTIRVQPGFSMWHHQSEVGNYWQWRQSGREVRILSASVTANYSNFNELMREEDSRAIFDVPLPESVQEELASGKRIVVSISAGDGWDGSGQLDIDRLFHIGLGEMEDTLEINGSTLTISLPNRFNFKLGDTNYYETSVLTLETASQRIAVVTGNENPISQSSPGIPIPECHLRRWLTGS